MIHIVKDFGVVNEADVFLEFSCFFYDPVDGGNLISGSSAFSKSSLNIWKFTVHLLFKPGLGNFEHYFNRVWDECSCAVIWAFFGIAFLWNWNENWPFAVLWPLLSFPNLLTSLVVQMVKCLPTMRETWVQSLGGEDLLEKEMATHSSILATNPHPPAP